MIPSCVSKIEREIVTTTAHLPPSTSATSSPVLHGCSLVCILPRKLVSWHFWDLSQGLERINHQPTETNPSKIHNDDNISSLPLSNLKTRPQDSRKGDYDRVSRNVHRKGLDLWPLKSKDREVVNIPRMNRAMNRCHQEEVKACHRQVKLEIRQVTKMVPRRPSRRFIGSVNLESISAGFSNHRSFSYE